MTNLLTNDIKGENPWYIPKDFATTTNAAKFNFCTATYDTDSYVEMHVHSGVQIICTHLAGCTSGKNERVTWRWYVVEDSDDDY